MQELATAKQHNQNQNQNYMTKVAEEEEKTAEEEDSNDMGGRGGGGWRWGCRQGTCKAHASVDSCVHCAGSFKLTFDGNEGYKSRAHKAVGCERIRIRKLKGR